MTRIRDVSLRVSKTYSNSHVACVVDTIHAVKKVKTVLFQLESKGSLEVARVMYVPELKMNLLSVSNLEDEVLCCVPRWTSTQTVKGNHLGCSSDARCQAG